MSLCRSPASARKPVQHRARVVQPARHRVRVRRHPAQHDWARRAPQGGLVRDCDDGEVSARVATSQGKSRAVLLLSLSLFVILQWKAAEWRAIFCSIRIAPGPDLVRSWLWLRRWDAGMATFEHSPRGRGYDESLYYYHHANSYWTYTLPIEVSCPSSPSPCQARSPANRGMSSREICRARARSTSASTSSRTCN